MGVLVAQFLHRVGRKIHHHESATRLENPRRLSDRVSWLICKMEHHVMNHEIERLVIKW